MRLGHFLVFVPFLAACPSSSECEEDFDCGGGEVCANTHECLSSSDVRRVDVEWTLFGATPSATSCASIDRMELTVRDSVTDENATYSPVPCETGKFVFLKLPTRYDAAAMSAFVDGSFAEAEQGAIASDGTVYLDFQQGTTVDAGP